jgi:methionyl-tRNA synthetase
MRRLLVTSALPYANGPLHFGHILEAVQTDIWVRAMRYFGHEALYLCADDTHGTPMMLKAKALGITPEQLIEQVSAEHRQTYQGFLIDHAIFHSTHSHENRALTEELYLRLRAAGHIQTAVVRQAYDEQENMFLPDRYVKGTCPRCKAVDQYGDSCEACGATYTPSDLIDPISVLSQTTPVQRDSEHYFFRLGHFEKTLRAWTQAGTIDAGVRNKLEEWFSAGLRDWDISRDAPYFGFEIPDAPGKYFYVWLDAPVGYMGATLALFNGDRTAFDAYWHADSQAEVHHFIGKDILYFHTLFWPAVLAGAGLRQPTAVHAHGFLTVNGQKMSKSRGTFITGQRYLERLPPEPLRFYFASKLTPSLEDMDLSLEDFTQRFNSDVVGKIVNIASRCQVFLAKSNQPLSEQLPDAALYASFVDARREIATAYEARDFAHALRQISALADQANQYIDLHKPWLLAKDPTQHAQMFAIASQGINLFRVLMSYLLPVLPSMAVEAGRFLNQPFEHWDDIVKPLLGTRLNAYQPLAQRLDLKIVNSLIEPEGPAMNPAPTPDPSTSTDTVAPTATPTGAAAATITIDDLAKVDLKIGLVTHASKVEGSDKLLCLTIDANEAKPRTIFSGIQANYSPEQLIGQHVVFVANLKPRKMRFGTSEGMVLAASGDGSGVFVIKPDTGAKAGMTVS